MAKTTTSKIKHCFKKTMKRLWKLTANIYKWKRINVQYIWKILLKNNLLRGTSVAHLSEFKTLDFGLGHDLRALRLSPGSLLKILSLSSCPSPMLVHHTFMHILFISFKEKVNKKQINKKAIYWKDTMKALSIAIK